MRASAADSTPKLTIPSPNMVHYRGGRAAIDERVYPDMDEFWADLVAAYADEVRASAELGCRYLQFDDTSLAYLNDPAQREHIARDRRRRRAPARGIHPPHQRRAGRAAPTGMAVTTHMCRGNFRSSWVAEGGYDFVAEALFGELDVDGFFLEYDDERSGGFEPLRFVPQGQAGRARPGHDQARRARGRKDELKRRIEEASRYVDIDQLCLSPQCGFSSTVEGNALTRRAAGRQAALIVETAGGGLGLADRAVSSMLFGGIYARGAVADAVSDAAWVQAMLDVEAALGGIASGPKTSTSRSSAARRPSTPAPPCRSPSGSRTPTPARPPRTSSTRR